MHKNGKLEFYRFFFSVAIMLFHFEKYIMGEPPLTVLSIKLFPHGSIGVEYFFLLSGYFLGRSAFRAYHSSPKDDTVFSEYSSNENLRFLGNKYRRLFPEHLTAFIITFFVYSFCNHLSLFKVISSAVNSIPSFLLIQMSGFSFLSVNHIEWYLSSMLIAMAIIYPVCRRYYYGFTRYASPLLSLLTLGILYYNTKTLTGVMVWMSVTYKATIRAIVEISLGASAFELTRILTSKNGVSKTTRTILTLTEIMCFLGVSAFMLITFKKAYEFFALAAIFFMLICAASNMTYGNRLFNTPLFYCLGEFSYPLYLSQLSSIYLAKEYLSHKSDLYQVLFCTVTTVILALVISLVSKPLKKRFG